jgi:hypothetical protein
MSLFVDPVGFCLGAWRSVICSTWTALNFAIGGFMVWAERLQLHFSTTADQKEE